jgi:hypothetical protein
MYDYQARPAAGTFSFATDFISINTAETGYQATHIDKAALIAAIVAFASNIAAVYLLMTVRLGF